MNSPDSDDLMVRVRVYLSGLEPPVPADELTDEEVAGLVMEAIGCLQDWVIHGLLPERFRLPSELLARLPIQAEGTGRASPSRALKFGTPIMNTLPPHLRDRFVESLEEMRRCAGLPPLWSATPPAPPPPPR